MSSVIPENARSMTGQGHASLQTDLGTFVVEVRTVNNRGFKCVLRSSDSLSALDSRVESLVRKLIHRGSVNLSVTWKRPSSETLPQIDQQVLGAYFEQLQKAKASFAGDGATIDLAQLAMLPGVVVPRSQDRSDNAAVWEAVQQVIRDAVDSLDQMRAHEGAHMATSLRADCDVIRQHVDQIAELGPRSVDTYQKRLETKIQRVLAQHEIEVPVIDLLREVQIYADRVDYSEEITRLGSHLQLFGQTLCGNASGSNQAGGNGEAAGDPEPSGRKLEFIVQEMLRETNTIGSKASQTEISGHVVEIKCAIERMRELVQNLE
ncbi:YicC family protein [Novipirellula sp. SH528]|uniref:YicC family protein n=1 Tax=Novipirellula sp. SH528 TaxID=3454466 RepID=UPI003FA0E9A8